MIRVLFLQVHADYSTSAHLHVSMMRRFSEGVEVHVACPSARGAGVPDSAVAMSAVPGAHVRPTRFAPSVYQRSLGDVGRALAIGGPPAVAGLAGLVAYARRHAIDIVHSNERPRDALYGWLVGRLSGARTVLHMHTVPADWLTSRALWAMRQADGLLCVSQMVARAAVDRGVRPERTHVVRNGLDLDEWEPDAAGDGRAVRAELGIPADALLLSIVARVAPSKGHVELLEALGRLGDRVPPFRLVVVGDEDVRPGVVSSGASYGAALRAGSRSLGLADRVIFAGERGDVRRIMAATDIYAMPSRDEAFGMAFAEAMAMGCPVVALDAFGAPEVVDHGRTGLLSAPDDVEGLAANIARLAGDPALRRDMGRAGRERVEREFIGNRMAAGAEAVYRALVAVEPPVHDRVRAAAAAVARWGGGEA